VEIEPSAEQAGFAGDELSSLEVASSVHSSGAEEAKTDQFAPNTRPPTTPSYFSDERIYANAVEAEGSRFEKVLLDGREQWEKLADGDAAAFREADTRRRATAVSDGEANAHPTVESASPAAELADKNAIDDRFDDAFNVDDLSSLGGWPAVRKGFLSPPAIPEVHPAQPPLRRPLFRQPSSTLRLPKTDEQLHRDRAAKERQRRQSFARRRHTGALVSQLNHEKVAREADMAASAAKQWAAIGMKPPVALQRALSSRDDADALLLADADSRAGETHDLFGEMSATDPGSVLGTKGSLASTSKRTVADLDALVDRPLAGMECYICKLRQKGCPLCWDFPTWKKRPPKKAATLIETYVPPLCPNDYAFVPGGDDPRTTLDREVCR
jgi:hypothetical protein